MRALVDRDRLELFMRRLGQAASVETECRFTGGATAVLLGWRSATIDVDLALEPERDELLRAIQGLKDELQINVELVSPSDFVPAPPGSEDRMLYAGREGRVTFRHVDPYSQALAKLERGHARDLEDVRELLTRGLVEPSRLLELFGDIEGELFRYPAVDGPTFRRMVEAVVSAFSEGLEPED